MKIRTFIILEEAATSTALGALLASEPDVEVIAQTHPAALDPARWPAWQPDLVFLDVGSETADVVARLTELPRARVPAVVVMARTARHALAAFDAAALDYLLEPVQPGRLSRSLQRVREHLLARQLNGSRAPGLRPVPEWAPGPRYWSRIPVRDRERVVFVPVDTLLWAEAAENYVILHTTQGNYVIRQTLSALEAALNPEQFCRLNRSALINLEHLAELRPLFRGAVRGRVAGRHAINGHPPATGAGANAQVIVTGVGLLSAPPARPAGAKAVESRRRGSRWSGR